MIRKKSIFYNREKYEAEWVTALAKAKGYGFESRHTSLLCFKEAVVIRCKIFKKQFYDENPSLESQINSWFEDNPNITFMESKIITNDNLTVISILVFYKEPKRSTYFKESKEEKENV